MTDEWEKVAEAMRKWLSAWDRYNSPNIEGGGSPREALENVMAKQESVILDALSEQPQERVEGWSQGEPCPCGCENWTIRTKQKSAVGSWNRRATLIIHDTPDSPEGESDE